MIYLELKKSKQMTEKIGFFNICDVIDDVFLTLDTYTGGRTGGSHFFCDHAHAQSKLLIYGDTNR